MDKGYFMVIVKTAEKNLEKAQDIVQQIISKISKGDFTEEEVENSKRKLITMYLTSIETNAAISGAMATSEFLGLGYDNYLKYPERIKAVSRDAVISAAREILTMDKCAIVVVHSYGSENNK